MVRSLRIFAKGNVDVRDSLLWSRVGGKLEWNGLNQALRERGHRVVARLRHETSVGFDFIPLPGQTPPRLPAEVLETFPSIGARPLAQQHTSALFSEPSDAVVLSLQPDVMTQLVRHKSSELKLYAEDVRGWEPERRAWLSRQFESTPLTSVDEAMSALEKLLTAIDETLGAPVLIYNLCPILPGERAHSYLGAPDALALRLQKFNLALAELSAQRDFSIVDVQRISACAGAERIKVDLIHFNGEGWRLIAEEVVRILDARGLLGDAPPESIATG